MANQRERETTQALRELLMAEPTRPNWISLVSWLDFAIVGAGYEEPDTLPRRILVRLLVSMGNFMAESRVLPETVQETLAAAQRYLGEPTEQNSRALTHCATRSYPFGPGDGSYDIEETGFKRGQPGSGDRSGAGCLVDYSLDLEALMVFVQDDVQNWVDSLDSL